MSTVIVLTPLVITSWPLITAAITAALTTSGYVIAKETANVGANVNAENETVCEEIELENSEILAGARNLGESITVTKDNITATFHRDARGALRLAIEAKGMSKAELRNLGEELVGLVTQQYAYHRLVTEMKERGMTIVEEEVEADNTVKIRVRNW